MEKNIFSCTYIVMAIGVLPMPYGYYNILRCVVFGCAIFFAISLYNSNEIVYFFFFCLTSLLYNPIIPVHLYDKNLWFIVNACTALLFILNRKKIITD